MTRIMKETIDRLHYEMEERIVRLNDLDSKFGFLLEVKELLLYSNESISIPGPNILMKSCLDLGQIYCTDIDAL